MAVNTEQTPSRRKVICGAVGVATGGGLLASSRSVSAQATGSLIFKSMDSDSSISNYSADLEFYFTETDSVFTDTHSDSGAQEYDLSNLPETGPFIVYVDPSDTTYATARKYAPGADVDTDIYIRESATSTYNVQFQLNDFTGSFPKEDTILRVERSVNDQYVEIESDYFGATAEFEVDLETETRHRLSIYNPDNNEERFLGVITPNTDQLYTLDIRPERVKIIEEGEPLISVDPATRTLSEGSSSSVTISVDERDAELDEWTAIITYEKDGSSTELYNQTHANTTTEISPTLNLDNRSGGRVNVSVDAVTMDGTSSSKGALYRVREFIDHNRSLLAVLSTWGDEFGTQDATTFIAVLGSVLITGGAANYMRVSKEALGGIALLSLLGFAVIGWAPYTLIFACTVTYATMWALRRGL